MGSLLLLTQGEGRCRRGAQLLPLRDLCDPGGWKDAQTILKCYQQPDEDLIRGALDDREDPDVSRPAYSNTNGSPSANSALMMITLTKPIERKRCGANRTNGVCCGRRLWSADMQQGVGRATGGVGGRGQGIAG